MSSFVVMAPPEFDGLSADPAGAERLAFIPDRFSALAVVFSIPWMLVHRMWLVLLGYLALSLVIEVLALSLGAPTMAIAAAVISILFGFEAHALLRWSLSRKGWWALGVVEADRREDAEIRFFHGFASQTTTRQQEAQGSQDTLRNPIVPRIGGEQVIGLTLGPETRQ